MLSTLACVRGAPAPVLAPAPFDVAVHVVRVPSHNHAMLLLDTASGLVLGVSEVGRERIWGSTDDGQSWSELAMLPVAHRAWGAHDGCPDLHRIELSSDGLFHVRGLDVSAPSSRVADAGALELCRLVIAPDDRLGALWIDRGSGWPEVMFSQSRDHGASWSPGVRVNTESRRKETAQPVLLSHRGGWVVIWTENRDARTLFDLYGSFSEDGRHWAPSQRLNDDQEASFSVGAAAAEDERGVHVVTQDYREVNRFGDRDANIYYARMTAGAAEVQPGVRVNDVSEAPQAMPTLARDAKSGWLVAAWLDSRHRLTGDVYISVSPDGGLSWSPNRRLNVNGRPEMMQRPASCPRRAGGVYVLWRQQHGLSAQTWLAKILPGASASAPPRRVEPIPTELAGPLIDPLPALRQLYGQSFTGQGGAGVRPISGSWVVRDEALLAFGHSTTLAEWPGRSLADFVLEGRFRLDRREHLAAHLFLRVRAVPGEPDTFEGYEVRNHFRMGVLLSRTRFSTGRERLPVLMPEPRRDRWIPLRQDTWYEFRVVVAGSRLDYWLDGEWILSDDSLEPRAGTIVLGADGQAPVEWDDLRLYSLAASQDASSP